MLSSTSYQVRLLLKTKIFLFQVLYFIFCLTDSWREAPKHFLLGKVCVPMSPTAQAAKARGSQVAARRATKVGPVSKQKFKKVHELGSAIDYLLAQRKILGLIPSINTRITFSLFIWKEGTLHSWNVSVDWCELERKWHTKWNSPSLVSQEMLEGRPPAASGCESGDTRVWNVDGSEAENWSESDSYMWVR